jgi:hypothetical protein
VSAIATSRKIRKFIFSCVLHLAIVCFVIWIFSILIIVSSEIDKLINIPNRTLLETASMTLILPLISAFLIVLDVFPCFILTQFIQEIFISKILRNKSISSIFFLVLSTPMSTLLSCYIFDHEIPSFRWYTDSEPYWVHGLTFYRLLFFFCAQVFLTGFGWWELRKNRSVT